MVQPLFQTNLDNWAKTYETDSMDGDEKLKVIKDVSVKMRGINTLAAAIKDLTMAQRQFFLWCVIKFKSDRMKLLYFLGQVKPETDDVIMLPVWKLLVLGIMPSTKTIYTEKLALKSTWVQELEKVLNQNGQINTYVDSKDTKFCRGWCTSVAHLQTVHKTLNDSADLQKTGKEFVLPYDFEKSGKDGIKAFLDQRVGNIVTSKVQNGEEHVVKALTSLSPAFLKICLNAGVDTYNKTKLSSEFHNKG